MHERFRQNQVYMETSSPTVNAATQPSYYMKLINIHDVEVSLSAWVSHVMPLKILSIDVNKIRINFSIGIELRDDSNFPASRYGH